MMDKKLKAQWVKALLSGEYKQATGTLYDRESGGHCCLGVLCAMRNIDIPPNHGTLYARLHKELGEDDTRFIAGVNDEGVPFEMIAGLIDEAL